MKWLGNRLREPSTWAGLGMVFGGFGTALADVASQIESGVSPIAAIALGVAGLIAVVVKDPNNGRDSVR